MFRDQALNFLTSAMGQTGLVYYDVLFLALILAMTVGCYFEWQDRRLPNFVAQPALVGIIAWQLLVGDLTGWVAVLVIWGYFLWAWSKGFIGAGDAKGLMILTGLWPSGWIGLAFLVGWGVTNGLLYAGWALVRTRGQLNTWWSTLVTLPAHFLAPSPQLAKRDVLLIPAVVITVLFYLLGGRVWILSGAGLLWMFR